MKTRVTFGRAPAPTLSAGPCWVVATARTGLFWALTVVGAFALAGCAAGQIVPPQQIEQVVMPIATLAVQVTPTAAATPTPVLTPAPISTPIPTPTPAPAWTEWQTTKPNELGRIMILEYHLIGPEEDRWTRSYDNFWRDLETLYAKGYRPISLGDLVDNRIDVPAGLSPVVLTFDDSSPMQFRFIEKEGGQLEVDPLSAVGMLERFHAKHPDFPLKATFFVLPGADPPHDLFGQEGLKERKLQHLVDKGFEIGNHTFWHQRLDHLESKAAVDEQLGLAAKAVEEAVPGYQPRLLALPLGLHPLDPTWAREGVYEGTTYRHDAILLATGGSSVAPDHREFDPFNLPRIQATNMELDFEEVYIGYFDANPSARYVSDGDPDVIVFPRSLADDFVAGPGYRPIDLPADVALEYRAERIR